MHPLCIYALGHGQLTELTALNSYCRPVRTYRCLHTTLTVATGMTVSSVSDESMSILFEIDDNWKQTL